MYQKPSLGTARRACITCRFLDVYGQVLRQSTLPTTSSLTYQSFLRRALWGDGKLELAFKSMKLDGFTVLSPARGQSLEITNGTSRCSRFSNSGMPSLIPTKNEEFQKTQLRTKRFVRRHWKSEELMKNVCEREERSVILKMQSAGVCEAWQKGLVVLQIETNTSQAHTQSKHTQQYTTETKEPH